MRPIYKKLSMVEDWDDYNEIIMKLAEWEPGYLNTVMTEVADFATWAKSSK